MKILVIRCSPLFQCMMCRRHSGRIIQFTRHDRNETETLLSSVRKKIVRDANFRFIDFSHGQLSKMEGIILHHRFKLEAELFHQTIIITGS